MVPPPGLEPGSVVFQTTAITRLAQETKLAPRAGVAPAFPELNHALMAYT